ncbi:cytochrome P450 [Mycena leptocephala]|nr:cytochrome P450 [Mycena leptocephala]
MAPHLKYLYAAASVGLFLGLRAISKRRKFRGNHPPIIDIPASEIFNNPREAYEKALRDHGPVIAVWRKGFLEFIVDETLCQTVLTSDQSFSFEEAMATILNLRPFVSLFWSFFREIDDLVQNGINPMLSNILEQICPVFVRNAGSAVEHKTIDMFEHAHIMADVATDIAGLTGMYQNSSALGRQFPTLWAILTWVKVICTSILAFFRIIGPQVWKHVRSRQWVAGEEEPTSHAKNGTIGFGSFLWIMSLLMGIIFASVHQTASVAVWVVFELARQATWLDSFIREVMRTKGDTLNVCRLRLPTPISADIPSPKGNHLVFPFATLVHLNPAYHPEPSVFRPERWHGSNARPAIMSSASYISFGMGRWACPGRILAVSEIKMIVWSIIAKSTPRLEGNKYTIVDPLNITSVPPQGELVLEPFSFS